MTAEPEEFFTGRRKAQKTSLSSPQMSTVSDDSCCGHCSQLYMVLYTVLVFPPLGAGYQRSQQRLQAKHTYMTSGLFAVVTST